MKKMVLFFLLAVMQVSIFPSEHGIYMLVNSGIKADFNKTAMAAKDALKSAGFDVLAYYDIATPDIIREDAGDKCGFNAKLIVASSNYYTSLLTSYGNKYLAAGFLRVAVFQTPNGIHIEIADPETINRIVFNDLPDAKYNKIISQTMPWKKKLVAALQSVPGGNKVMISQEPKRDADDLRDASKDMFMMVGDMTFFEDEDQFPVIYEKQNTDGRKGLENLKQLIYKNVENFKPVKKDSDYRWTSSPDNLKWKLISEVYSPDSTAVLLGITRPRTEAISFKIVGKDESEGNMCPGINHIPAYPIEVLLLMNGNKITVQTPREMFRMDMFFWDAGMGAFMNHMSMPGILDDSIGRALLGKLFTD